MTFILQQYLISLIIVALLALFSGLCTLVVQTATEKIARGSFASAFFGFALLSVLYLAASLLFCFILRQFAVFAFADIAAHLDRVLHQQPLARAKVIKHLKSIVCPFSKTVPK